MFSNIKNNISLANNLYITRKNPVSLVHFVTNRCNARCSFCFINFDNPETFAHELTTDEIDQMTKNLGPNLQNVNLTGGEPFARKDFLDIARSYFKNTNVKSIFITSNGSLPDRVEPFLKTLSKEFPDRKILMSFSIDDLPEEHNRIRKIKGLFQKTIECYNLTKKFGSNIQGNIAITISHENHKSVPALYEYLINEHDVESFTIGIVRDEGVYRIPKDHKLQIQSMYKMMTTQVMKDLSSNRLKGWDKNSIQGRMMNKKNSIVYDIIHETYMTPRYTTPCRAGSLFGIIEANGFVRPCEILDKPLGQLRDYKLNFLELWYNDEAQETRKWIKDTKCNCHYDCAWSFNILANKEFQPALISAGLGIKKT